MSGHETNTTQYGIGSNSLVVLQEGAQADRVGALKVVVAEVLVSSVDNSLLEQHTKGECGKYTMLIPILAI